MRRVSMPPIRVALQHPCPDHPPSVRLTVSVTVDVSRCWPLDVVIENVREYLEELGENVTLNCETRKLRLRYDVEDAEQRAAVMAS